MLLLTLVLIMVAGVVGFFVWRGVGLNSLPFFNTVKTYTPVVTAPTIKFPGTASSGTDEDLQALDQDTSALEKDLSSIDAALNDKPGDLSE